MPQQPTPATDDSPDDSLVSSFMSAAAARTTAGLDANPDDAARAASLSRDTGVPSQVIAPDLDGFEKDHQRALATKIVASNPHLMSYVLSDPMAASISNDDWGNLGQYSSVADQTAKALKAVNAPFTEAFRAGARTIWEELNRPIPQITPEEVGKQIPALGRQGILPAISREITAGGLNLGSIIGGGLDAIYGSIVHGTGEAVRAGAEAAGVSSSTAESLGREASAFQEYRMAEAVPGHPWVMAGHEPPTGIHPAIDAAKAEANAKLLEQIDRDLALSRQSQTWERDPETFRRFAEQHYGNASISIPGDSAVALYADKPPEPNDGLLGWVPDIASKLDVAKQTGSDIDIPVASWISQVDSSVAKALRDDIRVWPGGITTREATELGERQYPATIPEPLAQIRSAAGLEPMFQWGDRKITLEKSGGFEIEGAYAHTYQILDETNKPVGNLELWPNEKTKQIYVGMIDGAAGMHVNSFGPALMRDLLRQIKALYPDYTELYGYRVSGAREAAGTVAKATVRLDVGDLVQNLNDWEATKGIFGAAFRDLGQGVVALVPEQMSTMHVAMADALEQEIRKVAGGGVEFTPTGEILSSGRRAYGVFMNRAERVPRILVDLLGPDPMGTTRHESMHFLEDRLLTNAERKVLHQAAIDEGWLDRYDIKKRYAHVGQLGQRMEAIAEAFREWKASEDLRTTDTSTGRIFQKIADFLDALKQRVARILGYDPTWEELFQQINHGKMARRESSSVPREPPFVEGESIRDRPLFQIGDEMDNLRAESLGLDLKSFQKLQKDLKAHYESDLVKAQAKAERDQTKRQSAEWKANRADMVKEVESSIRQRPDVAADLFIGSGELMNADGKVVKLQQRFTLRAEDMAAEQAARLPAHYVSKNGLPVDEVAKIFGYGSGDAMLDHLASYNALKEGRTPQEMLKYVAETEADRRMEAKYGDLPENILSEAKAQALSETGLNLLTDEYLAAGLKAGKPTLTKDVIQDQAKDMVQGMIASKISSDRQMQEIGKHYRDAVRALIAGDQEGAVQHLERRTLSAFVAREMLNVEKDQLAADRLFKSLARWKKPGKTEAKTVDPEYLNYAHDIMVRIGKTVARSVQGIQEDIARRGTGTLQEFIETKQAQLRPLDIWDQLFDPSWSKPYDDLTVDEFQAVYGSVKQLNFHGRDELKIIRAGEKVDKDELVDRMIDSLQRFPEITYDVRGERIKGKFQNIRTYIAKVTQMETLANYFDKYDTWGDWNQALMRGLFENENSFEALSKKYAKVFAEADDGSDLSKAVDNPIFRLPRKDGSLGPLVALNRENLRAVLLNIGNSSGPKSNLVKLAKGYELEPDVVQSWVMQHATKADWDWAQKIWDGVFDSMWQRGAEKYTTLTGGVVPDRVKITSIDTPWGTYRGGYFPIDYHPNVHFKPLGDEKGLVQSNWQSSLPNASWAQTRTGYSGPINLTLNRMPMLIRRELWDIEMREPLINASKILLDSRIQDEVYRRMGKEYSDLFKPYLVGLANRANYMTAHPWYANSILETWRKNLITGLIGFNPSTVMKHFPTALVLSMREVGVDNYLRATRGLYTINEQTGELNKKFIWDNFEEIQRRDRNWEQTLYGELAGQLPGSRYETLQQKIARWSSKPVALSDMISAMPTALAAYTQAIEEGRSLNDARYAGERAVRRAHGSTALTNRPAIMREWNPWLTSVYTFFNDIVNRQMEALWRSGEMLGEAKEGNRDAAMKMVPYVTGSLFALTIWPAIVEELVSPTEKHGDRENWLEHWAKAGAYTLSSGFPGIRDLVHAALYGTDPTIGMGVTGAKQLFNVYRDVGKREPLSPQHAQRLIQDSAGLVAMLTGYVTHPIGNATAFGFGVHEGTEHPNGPWGWLTGLRYGTLRHHSSTFTNWWENKPW